MHVGFSPFGSRAKNTAVLQGALVDEIQALKSEPGKDIVTTGSDGGARPHRSETGHQSDAQTRDQIASARARLALVALWTRSNVSWMLELTHVNPNWFAALSVALVRPNGEPERRHGQHPWQQRGHAPRSRRVTDDLAWLRVALCDPEPHGLHPLSHGRAVAAWVPDDDAVERLRRLRDRAILEAAGFRLFEDEAAHT